MKFYYVYILKCSDNSYYVGITNNFERRIIEHNEGYDSKSYTFKRRPLELVYLKTFNDSNQAILFEKQIKGWSRKKKEALINDNCEVLPELSMNKEKRLRQAQPDKQN